MRGKASRRSFSIALEAENVLDLSFPAKQLVLVMRFWTWNWIGLDHSESDKLDGLWKTKFLKQGTTGSSPVQFVFSTSFRLQYKVNW